MKKKIVVLAVIGFVLILMMAACSTPNPLKNVPLEKTGKVYGFLDGLGNGVTAVFAFIGNIFEDSRYNIYQVHNNGGWYNFGYLIGVGVFFGGISYWISRRNCKPK